MRRTALSIIQSVARAVNVGTVTSIEGSGDPYELQLLEILVLVLEDLRRRGPFRQQIYTHEFDTVSGENTIALPGSFYSALPRTQYNQDTDWQLIGPLTDSEFQAYKEGELYIPTEYVWRIKGHDNNSASTEGRQLELYPTPAAVENLTFEFVTGHLYVPANWAVSTAYSLNDFVTVNGHIYKCTNAGTSGGTSASAPSGTDDSQDDNGVTWDHYDEIYIGGYQGGGVSPTDTDLCIFDADIVKLGLKAFYYEEANSILSDRARAEYERAIQSQSYRFHGQSRAFGDQRRALKGGRHRPYVSPGSWTWS
jgi:hypothetical protein